MSSPITTHVLDTTLGQPASGVPVTLEFESAPGAWSMLGKGHTDADGRIRDLLPAGTPLAAGTYRLTFETESYFARMGTDGFYPHVPILFRLANPGQHYHVPLLLNPYGYSTYRGS
jgi:5-hydroxyisourate hydrolase